MSSAALSYHTASLHICNVSDYYLVNALGNMTSILGGKAASETSLVLTDFLQLRKNTIFKSKTMLTASILKQDEQLKERKTW